MLFTYSFILCVQERGLGYIIKMCFTLLRQGLSFLCGPAYFPYTLLKSPDDFELFLPLIMSFLIVHIRESIWCEVFVIIFLCPFTNIIMFYLN